MTPVQHGGYIFASTVFAAIFLVAIIVYGGEWARIAALTAAFVACWSQFTAQDAHTDIKIWRVSIWTAYASFLLSTLALLLFGAGR